MSQKSEFHQSLVPIQFPDVALPAVLLATGRKPGSTQTTTSDNLAVLLGLEEAHGGNVWRQLARIWNTQYRTQKGGWNKFIEDVSTLEDEDKVRILTTRQEHQDDSEVQLFNTELDKHPKFKPFLRVLPEMVNFRNLPNGWSGIIQGDISIVAPKLLELPVTELSLPIIRLLYEVDTNEGARRVFKRNHEGREPMEGELQQQITENEERVFSDIKDFVKIFNFNPNKLDQTPGTYRIETTDLNEAEVTLVSLGVVAREMLRNGKNCHAHAIFQTITKLAENPKSNIDLTKVEMALDSAIADYIPDPIETQVIEASISIPQQTRVLQP